MRIPAPLRSTLLAAALAACGGAGSSAPPAPDAEAALEVQNLGFADVTVYAISATGSRVRLGLVNGHTTRRLALPAHLVRGGERLRFLADPIGGSRAPVSEELPVGPGETVTIVIPPT